MNELKRLMEKAIRAIKQNEKLQEQIAQLQEQIKQKDEQILALKLTAKNYEERNERGT